MASKTTVVKRKQPEQSASSGGSQLSSKRMKYVSEYLPRVAELVRSSASSQSQTSSTSDEDYIPALPSNTLSRYYHCEEPVVGSEESSDSGSVVDETDSPEEILQTARVSAVFLSQISDDIVAASSLARNRCVKGHRTLEPTVLTTRDYVLSCFCTSSASCSMCTTLRQRQYKFCINNMNSTQTLCCPLVLLPRIQ